MTISTDVKPHDFDVKLGDEFAELIAEFFHIPLLEARHGLDWEFRHPGAHVAKAWRLANPRTPDEITLFYRKTDSYVYDLAADHCNARRRPVQTAIIERIERRGSAQNILIYGDGIGSDSIALTKHGHRVTYFDLPSITSGFARYRFTKEGLQDEIEVIEEASDINLERFDVVICIEVLEHVPDPPAVMQTLHQALKYGGIALITESFESVGAEYPSHLPTNYQYAGRTHRLMEGLGFANTYYNTNPINRPMEFTKVRPILTGKWLQLKGKLRRAAYMRWPQIHSFTGDS